MAKEVFNVLIVNRRFVLLLFFKVSVQAPFRHRYRFKSTSLAPVSEKNQMIPIPTNTRHSGHMMETVPSAEEDIVKGSRRHSCYLVLGTRQHLLTCNPMKNKH